MRVIQIKTTLATWTTQEVAILLSDIKAKMAA